MKSITAKELYDLLKNEEAVLIDVREQFEYQSFHIKDAILIPSSNFDEDKIFNPKNKKVVIYCKSGRRSGIITKNMKDKNHYNLEGGIDAWIKENFEIERNLSENRLPLDRQVQLTIGTILILSSFLTYFIHQNFIFISFFIGLGLSFAGFSGYCGLAILLSRASWNKVFSEKEIKSCNM